MPLAVVEELHYVVRGIDVKYVFTLAIKKAGQSTVVRRGGVAGCVEYVRIAGSVTEAGQSTLVRCAGAIGNCREIAGLPLPVVVRSRTWLT